MSDFLDAFSDLISWVFQVTVDWDSVIFTLPVGFIVCSVVILMTRKLVGLR